MAIAGVNEKIEGRHVDTDTGFDVEAVIAVLV
jgi:hypothetical protein